MLQILAEYRDAFARCFCSKQQEGKGMKDRSSEIRYLRDKARQFRELANTHKSELSSQLLAIAEEFERRADQLEHRG